MKAPITKSLRKPPAPVFTIAVRQRGANAATAASAPKATRRDKVFSQSRDTREDRGARQMKTSQNPQTFPHSR